MSVSSLSFTSLLGRESYKMLRRAKEVEGLEDPAISWVGPAIALFLHALFYEATSGSGRFAAWPTFEAVMQMESLDGILFHPEVVVEEDVQAFWDRMHGHG